MNRAVYELKEGYELMYSESRKFLRLFREDGEIIKKKYPNAKVYNVHNDNFSAGCSIELNNFTLTAYYSIPTLKSASGSFLSIYIYDIPFNEKGRPLSAFSAKKFDQNEHRLKHSTYNLHSFLGFLRWLEISEKSYNYSSEQLLMKWSVEFLKVAANFDLGNSLDTAA